MDTRWFRHSFLVWLILIVVVVAIAVNLFNHSQSNSTPVGLGQLMDKAKASLIYASSHSAACPAPSELRPPRLSDHHYSDGQR